MRPGIWNKLITNKTRNGHSFSYDNKIYLSDRENKAINNNFDRIMYQS
jgi:hypothetical protein